MQGEIDIKRFKRLKRISKGAFGVVYKVEDKKTGEIYAAKIIDCDDEEDKCNEMINREVNILMCTNHPTIIKFIGYSKTDFQGECSVTIIMELAQNGSLRNVIKMIQQNIGPKNYTNTSRQIILVGVARGMKYLHDRNIIHRDIKPENILLDEDFHPHITDFGLSKIFDAGHSYSQTKFGGTLAYEAPEILKMKKYNRKVDVYSFAILMFEILTDSVPYPELDKNEIADFDFKSKVVNDNYRPKFDVPVKESFRELIEQCWSDDPNDRPTFSEIFDKLSNKNKSDDYLLEDVDMDELNLYIEDINEVTDNTDHLMIKISLFESEIKKLKLENKKQIDANKALESDNKKLRDEIKKLKTENKSQSETIKSIKNELEQTKKELEKSRNIQKQMKEDETSKPKAIKKSYKPKIKSLNDGTENSKSSENLKDTIEFSKSSENSKGYTFILGKKKIIQDFEDGTLLTKNMCDFLNKLDFEFEFEINTGGKERSRIKENQKIEMFKGIDIYVVEKRMNDFETTDYLFQTNKNQITYIINMKYESTIKDMRNIIARQFNISESQSIKIMHSRKILLDFVRFDDIDNFNNSSIFHVSLPIKKPKPKTERHVDYLFTPKPRKSDSFEMRTYLYQIYNDDDINQIELSSDSTVMDFKRIIAVEHDVEDLHNVKIMFAGKDLLDDLYLDDLRIGSDILFVYIRTTDDILLLSCKALYLYD